MEHTVAPLRNNRLSQNNVADEHPAALWRCCDVGVVYKCLNWLTFRAGTFKRRIYLFFEKPQHKES